MIPDFFMQNNYSITISTPIGFLNLISDSEALLKVVFAENPGQPSGFQPDILKETAKQLNEYFAGNRKEFDLNINPEGTQFQSKIWKLVENVPFGETTTYLDIALKSGSVKNTRAVGLANGRNPIPIIIPCHRIIGSNGKLTGYAGGTDRKKWLLTHELKYAAPVSKLF